MPELPEVETLRRDLAAEVTGRRIDTVVATGVRTFRQYGAPGDFADRVTPPGPNGFSEQMAAWASPEGMKLRLDFCAQVAGRMKDPPNPSDLLEALCGGGPSPETRSAIARAESRQQGLALLLMSPEMQRS